MKSFITVALIVFGGVFVGTGYYFVGEGFAISLIGGWVFCIAVKTT